MGTPKKSNRKQKDLDAAIVSSARSEDLADDFRKAMEEAASKSDTASIRDKKSVAQEAVWLTDNLLTFADFCESAEHMNFPPLSQRQKMVAEYMFGNDPKNIFDNNRNTAILAWGKGSLQGNEEIVTSDGIRITIAECAARNIPVSLWSRNPNTGRVVKVLSTPAIKKPEQENCFRVKTSFGHISEASEDHQYFTAHGWRKLKDIKVGDWILGGKPRGIDNIYDEPEKLCRWVGYVIGDGCLSGDHKAQFFASKPDIIADYVSLVENFCGIATVRRHNTPASRIITMSFGGKGRGPLYVHAKRLGIYGKTAKDKRIPVQIMFSSEPSRRSFLEALYSTDGWISRHSKSRGGFEIGYIAKNRKLIEDLDFMLRGFGIVGKIRPKYVTYKGKRREYWQLIICHRHEQRKFSSLLRIPGKSKSQSEMDAYLSIKTSERGFSCPPELTGMCMPAVSASAAGDEFGGVRVAALRGRVKAGQSYSYETVKSIPGMDALANEDVVWEQVISIEPLGMQDVYTFTVPFTKNYLQGGLFHHNSGKDTISALMMLYVVYILLNIKNPQRYLGLPDNVSVDLLNVASCVTRDTLVKVSGGWKSVADIVNGDMVATWDGRHQPVGKLFKFKDRPVFSLMLKNGMRVRCTDNHRFKVLRDGSWEEVELKDLSVGDTLWYGQGLSFGNAEYVSRIEYKKRTNAKPLFGSEMRVTNDIAYMLGLAVSDGFLSKERATAGRYAGWVVPEFQPEVSADVERIGNTSFCGRLKKSLQVPKIKGKFRATKGLLNYKLCSRDFWDHAKSMGMKSGGKKGHKGFPWRVLSGSRDSVRHLLAGMFDGDGSFSHEIKYYSVSEEIIGWASMALNGLGISTDVWFGHGIYSLTIPNSDVDKFLSEVPIRRNVAGRIMDRRAGPSKVRKFHGVMDMVNSDCGIAGRYSHNGQSSCLVDTLPSPAAGTMTRSLVDSRVYSSEIFSIRPDGVEDVFDYEALPDKEMVANGIMSIDSKEQAQQVYFQIVKTLALNWPWLRNKYDLVINGRFFSSGQSEESEAINKVTVTTDALIFPKNIRLFSGSCVSGDTLISCDGGLKFAEDIRPGDRILSEDGKPFRVKSVSSRDADIHRVWLRNGMFLDCTLDHPVLVFRDSKFQHVNVSELKPGEALWFRPVPISDEPRNRDVLVGDNGGGNGQYQQLFESGVCHMTAEMAYLVGLYLSGGHSSPSRHSISWTQNAGPVLDRLISFTDKLFPGRAKRRMLYAAGQEKTIRGVKTTASADHWRVDVNSIDLEVLFSRLGVNISGDCQNKGFARRLMAMDREIVRWFIAGLFDGDGSIGADLRYISVSRELAGNVCIALNMLGIRSSTHFDKGRRMYSVRIFDSSRQSFLDTIPCVRRGESVASSGGQRGSRRFHGFGPLAHELFTKHKAVVAVDDTGNESRARKGKYITENFISGRGYLLDDPNMAMAFYNGFSSSEVAGVEFLKRGKVYNYFEPKTQCMIANGILTLDCEAESLEGRNLLMFVLDEADAFKTGSQIRSASKIYRTVRTSAVSRFGKKYKGFIISYPRSATGFIMTMYKQSKGYLNMYGDIAKTWEVKPREMFSPETFQFEGYDVPMEFYEDFRLDPTGSKAAYICDPPEVESLFLDDPEKIDLATTGFVRPLFDFQDYTTGEYVQKKVVRAPFRYDKRIQHVLLLDLSLKKDSTALTLMHRDGDKILVDFATAWIPDPRQNLVVDLQNVEEVIKSVSQSVNISGLYCDRWQSALLVQKLRGQGMKADTVKLEYDDFELFKRLLYAGNIQLPKNDRLLSELKSLQKVTQQRVDHPEGGHNDLAVTIVMGVKMLAKATNTESGLGLLAEGEFVGDNLSSTADEFDEYVEEKKEGLRVDGFPL